MLEADVMVQGEPFSETKRRIQVRIGALDKDFAKYKFTLVASTVFKQPSAVEDGESCHKFTSISFALVAMTAVRGA